MLSNLVIRIIIVCDKRRHFLNVVCPCRVSPGADGTVRDVVGQNKPRSVNVLPITFSDTYLTVTLRKFFSFWMAINRMLSLVFVNESENMESCSSILPLIQTIFHSLLMYLPVGF